MIFVLSGLSVLAELKFKHEVAVVPAATLSS